MERFKIKSIRKLQTKEARYDLSVENTNNFFANGVLVHNCRCLTIIQEDEIKFFSRSGKQFKTLDNLKNDIKKYFSDYKSAVLDGEICLVDKDGKESFSSIMKEITRKDHTIENPKYFIFDFIPLKDFFKCFSSFSFTERMNHLPNEIGGRLELLPQIRINSYKEFKELEKQGIENGWEGLILKKNGPYEGKRTKNLLKVKSFLDAEYMVEDVYFTKKRMLNKNGLEEEVECLGGVSINHKGFRVDVGSGWDDQQRIFYREHPEEIVGKIITVKYFEETKNDDGTISLRFPIVKHIYEGEREI